MRLLLAVFMVLAVTLRAASQPPPPPGPPPAPPASAQSPVVPYCWDAAAGALVACPVSGAQPTALTNSSACTVPSGAAGILIPVSTTRKWVMLTNRTTGAETQDVGSSNVTVGGGIPLPPGGGFLFAGPGAKGPIYGISTVSSPCSFVEG